MDGTGRDGVDGGAPSDRRPIPIEVHGGVVRPLKTAEVVARQILQGIVDDHLTSGAGLPAEAQMMALYGVSRESLREALRLLEVQGLIHIRRGPGGGPPVGTVDPAVLGRMATMFFQMAGSTYAELFEAWQVVEVQLAVRAAGHPDAKRRAEVMAPYLDGPGPHGITEETSIGTQSGFHAAVASLAHNSVLQVVWQIYGQIVSHHAVVTHGSEGWTATVYHEHREIARAIRGGHTRQARDLMADHVDRVIAYQERQPDTPPDGVVAWI